MIRFWLVDKDDRVVFNTTDKQEAYEYQNRRRPDTVLKTVCHEPIPAEDRKENENV